MSWVPADHHPRKLEIERRARISKENTELRAEIERLLALTNELGGALQVILAFYEPGQRYLDTEAWKNAEASGRAAHAKWLAPKDTKP